ncbi:MAG: histidine phosphatase family protein [Proteobacteria bacterium]|jgi:phosphohistidine phosphatase SixA|nr:histidine phosphatase family protein [Pseudomonadota bacterium]
MRINRRFASLALALLLVGCGGTARTVYVVRHAEKAVSADAPEDPPLAEQGTLRTAALAREIDVASLVAVYSTPYARTKGTAAPSAAAAGLEVIEYAPNDVAGLVAKIRSAARGGVLVVGHSNTVPEILEALGVAEPVTLGESDFGDLFVVTLAPDGTATMERKRFGE